MSPVFAAANCGELRMTFRRRLVGVQDDIWETGQRNPLGVHSARMLQYHLSRSQLRDGSMPDPAQDSDGLSPRPCPLDVVRYCRQHFLYFLPLPHGQGSLRPMRAAE